MVRSTTSNVLRRITTLLIITSLLTVGLSVNTAAALPGSGTQEDPWRIQSLADFDEFAAEPNYWDDYTRLETDVNLAGRTYSTAVIAPDVDNSDAYFDGTPFTGVFDGNDHKIIGLTIDDGGTGNDYLGLFGCIYGEVRNLGLEGGSVSGTGSYSQLVGGLVGDNGGSISNCFSTGGVSGDYDVGGLVGRNYGTLSNCYSTGDVNGGSPVGGLVGWNYRGSISNCYSTGDVNGVSGVGGLAGSNGGSIITSFWDIETSGQSTSAGGIGKTTGEMKTANTFFLWGLCGNGGVWTIDDGKDYPRLAWENKPGQLLPQYRLSDFLEGSGTEYDPYLISNAEQFNLIGLFLCDWDKNFLLTNDVNSADYTVTKFNIIGIRGYPFAGIFDGNDHKIWNFTWDSNGVNYIGFFGYLGDGGQIKNLGLENVDVNAVNGSYVGSLVGENAGNVSNCYSTGDVNGVSYVGGLVGRNYYGTISNCYSTGEVSGSSNVGALVGQNGSIDCIPMIGCLVRSGYIYNSYSTGSVQGASNVGGLVGCNYGTISDCYSTDSLSATSSLGGGLVGYNGGTISNSYSTGCVNGVSHLGGLVGFNAAARGQANEWEGDITNCYSTASVTGTGDNVGGLCGSNSSTISACFWDIQTSGEPNMCGDQSEDATGCDPNCAKTTAEMQTRSTFTEAGWDFVEIWLINDGATYPVLRQEIRSDLNGDAGVDFADFAVFADHWLEGTGD